jgi:hypothetical protein
MVISESKFILVGKLFFDAIISGNIIKIINDKNR